MNRSPRHAGMARLWLLLAAMLTMLLTACGAGSDDDQAATSTDLQGWAHVSGPLVGARVRVLSRDGQELAVARHPTYTTGTWHVNVPSLPASYTIEITGGQDDDQPFTGTLLHDESGADRSMPIAVNIATTLAARVKALGAASSDQAAADAVRRHLMLPDGIELHRHLRQSGVYFSADRFLQARPAGVGFDAYLDAMARQVGVSPVQSYRGLAAPAGNVARKARLAVDTSLSANEAGADASQVLLASAVGGPDAGAMALGNILISKIFGGGDGVVSALNKILNKLVAINERLDGLQDAINQLQATVGWGIYNAGVAPLTDLRTDLDLVWPLYESIVQANPADEAALKATRANFVSKMAEGLTGANTDLRAYRMRQYMDSAPALLMGDVSDTSGAGGSGVLTLWNKVVLTDRQTGDRRFVSTDDQAKLAYAHHYWQLKQAQLYVVLKEFAPVLAHPKTYGLKLSLKNARFFDAQWDAQFLPGKAADGTLTPSASFLQQSAAADHVAELTPLPKGFLYDRALGIVWAADVSSYPEAQRQIVTDYGTWNAVDLVDDGNGLWQFAPKAFAALKTMSQLDGWTYPTPDQLKSLIQPRAHFTHPQGEASDKMHFLINHGFGSWLVRTKWDQWTYGSDMFVTVGPNEFFPRTTFRVRQIVNLDTGDQHTSCDDVGDPHNCNRFGDDPWRLTPGGFLAVHVPAAGVRYAPDGW